MSKARRAARTRNAGRVIAGAALAAVLTVVAAGMLAHARASARAASQRRARVEAAAEVTVHRVSVYNDVLTHLAGARSETVPQLLADDLALLREEGRLRGTPGRIDLSGLLASQMTPADPSGTIILTGAASNPVLSVDDGAHICQLDIRTTGVSAHGLCSASQAHP